jgi:predicted NAD-dependent protein-ADP-ribosyltransferase YbiA (DUF1768 family)
MPATQKIVKPETTFKFGDKCGKGDVFSNMYRMKKPLEINGRFFLCLEVAYHLAKLVGKDIDEFLDEVLPLLNTGSKAKTFAEYMCTKPTSKFWTHDKVRYDSYLPLKKAARKWHTRVKMREDWDNKKVPIMYRLLHIRAHQDTEFKEALLATGNLHIIEVGSNPFWSIGKDQKGQNQLGKLMVRVRRDLRSVRSEQSE